MELNQAAEAFGALSQPNRLAVLRLLGEAGSAGARPSQMATRLQIPANTLSFHLRQLRQAGLISEQRSGRDRIYRVNLDRLQHLVRYLGTTAGPQNSLAPEPVSLATDR
ncbi:MAG: Transcriptional regulator, ArsR family [Pseudomonadota bacterium]|jgi:DNA-binding transcriptional ArsR family regulator